MRRVVRHPMLFLWLVAVWVGLWGSLTFANVLGGVVLAFALLLLLPMPEVPHEHGARLVPLLRLFATFGVDLVRATLSVAWLVLQPRLNLQPGVVAVPIQDLSDRLLTLVANAVSLTPGTLSLDVDRERGLLFVHVLHLPTGPGGRVDEAAEQVRASILRFERLALRTFAPQAPRQEEAR